MLPLSKKGQNAGENPLKTGSKGSAEINTGAGSSQTMGEKDGEN